MHDRLPSAITFMKWKKTENKNRLYSSARDKHHSNMVNIYYELYFFLEIFMKIVKLKLHF